MVGLRRAAPGAHDEVVDRLTGFVDDLHADVEAGLFTGAQVAVWLDGEPVCDAAVGECLPGRRMSRSTVHNLYCALKPVVAMSLANVLEARAMTEAVRVRDVLPPAAREGVPDGVRLADVLAHDCGLRSPLGIEYVFMGGAERASSLTPSALLRAREAEPAVYSEVGAFAIVAAVVEWLTGRPAVEQVEHDLAAAGVREVWLRATGDDDPRIASIGCYSRHRGGEASPVPLLHDRIEHMWRHDHPCAIGGYASMRGLGQWYAALAKVWAGTPHPGFPSPELVRRWTSPQRARTFDAVLQRECSFGCGFMTGLRDHNFGVAPSAVSFGHAGWFGLSYAFADPEVGIVAAILTNGIRPDPRVGAEVDRRIRVASLYGLLDRDGGAP
jgi:CubicO group peptidase (beta-lactamase class C family)